MSAPQYLEINSAFRNRSEYPLPGEFDVFFSQSGTKNKYTANDPVCTSAVRLIWTPFKPVSGKVVPYPTGVYPNDTGVGAATSRESILIQIDSGTFPSRAQNFYAGAVLVVPPSLPGGVFSYYRILSSIFYLVGPKTTPQTSVLDTYDYFLVTINNSSNTNPQPNSVFEIRDPSQFTGSDYPVIPFIVKQYYFPTLFIPTGVNSTNYYINYIIYNQTHNEWLPVTYYDGTTHMASTYPYNTTNLEFSSEIFTHFTPGVWGRDDTYILRKAPPEVYGSIVAVNPGNPKQVQIPLTSSNIPNYYVGSFLRNQVPFQYSNFVNPNYRIVAYDPKFPDWAGPPGSTIPVVTLDKIYDTSLTPLFEILQFSYDNEFPYTYDGSIVSQREAVCYDVQLLNIVLPNAFLETANGSRVLFYPFIYVELTPMNNSERFGPNSINSNNPNARRMLFRAIIRDYVSDTTSPFVKIDAAGMVQRVKLLPCDNFHFSVRLPDGNIFRTVLPEYYSPDLPNELKQISAVFSFKRVE